MDTSVWSLAWRRDQPEDSPEVDRLSRALLNREDVVSTGLVLQELLQGFHGPSDRDAILERFEPIPLLTTDRSLHVEAAEIRDRCRRSGVQIGTVDALLAGLCIRHQLDMLSTDRDFVHVARVVPLSLWRHGSGDRANS